VAVASKLKDFMKFALHKRDMVPVSENGGAKLVHGSGGIWLAAGGVKLCHL
jgi:hypothetical protein